MASVIVETVGDPDANSYVTMAEAITYMGDRLHKSAWENAGSAEKTAALIWAARLIDSRVEWMGSRTDESQAMAWPRMYVPDPDPAYTTDTSLYGYLPSDVIPVDIKNAQFELALALLNGDVTAEPGSTGLSSLAVGSLKLDFAGNSQQPETFPRQVDEIICKYGVVRSAKSSVRKLVRT
jgi:hypothetical protein